MPELIALRAAFGQDEANHGIRRYRVGGDGLVHVPAVAAFFLVSKGGFAVANTTVAPAPGGSLRAPLADRIRSATDPSSLVRLHHDSTGGCRDCGCNYQGDQDSNALVPAEAADELILRGFLPATQDLRPGEREVGPEPIGLEISSVGSRLRRPNPSRGGAERCPR